MRVVIAPDSFKGTLSATEATAAIAEGWAAARPLDELILRPMADGGEGTLDSFAGLPAARLIPVPVVDAIGRQRQAHWVKIGDLAVIELGHCCGLLTIEELAPLTASTFGFGLAIKAALEAGATRLLLAIGSSASTDGGAGLLAALGLRLIGGSGQIEEFGNRALRSVVRVIDADLVALPSGGVQILSDVTNPLLGANGAARVFGPQKGGGDLLDELELGLEHWSQVLGGDPLQPGAGAAGGAGYGLQWWGATTVSGAVAVAEAIELPAALAAADLVITGEGSYDAQTANGKVAHVVRELAGRKKVVVFAGRVETPDIDAVSLTERAGALALSESYATLLAASRDFAAQLSR